MTRRGRSACPGACSGTSSKSLRRTWRWDGAQDVVALADQVNAVTTSIEEIHYWRGRALAMLGDTAGAAQAIQQALALNPSFVPAQQAAAELNS